MQFKPRQYKRRNAAKAAERQKMQKKRQVRKAAFLVTVTSSKTKPFEVSCKAKVNDDKFMLIRNAEIEPKVIAETIERCLQKLEAEI